MLVIIPAFAATQELPMDMEAKHAVYRENFKITFNLAGEHAKWLLSTLLLLNSGAIAGVFQKNAGHTNMAVAIFAIGVFFALASGVVGWSNLQWAARYYAIAANDILTGKSEQPLPRSVILSRTLAIFAAFSSIGCLILGAAFTAWAFW
jgi:hypothetical protein